MNELKIAYDVDLPPFRRIWMEMFRAESSKFLVFWGTAVAFCLLWVVFVSREPIWIFCLVSAVAVPLLFIFFSYRAFMRAAESNYAKLPQADRHVEMIFRSGSDGFECRAGKNYSFIAWESITGFKELSGEFVFDRAGNAFVVPKSAFVDGADLIFFRDLVSANVSAKVISLGR